MPGTRKAADGEATATSGEALGDFYYADTPKPDSDYPHDSGDKYTAGEPEHLGPDPYVGAPYPLAEPK